MPTRNGSLSPKPWWKSRREHAAPGPGGVVLAFADRATVVADSGARLLDSVTLGFRTGSFTALLDPTGVRARELFLLLAGLKLPDSGRVDVRLQPCARKPGRLAAVALVHEDAPLDPTLTARENLLAALASTGVVASHEQFRSALELTGLAALADAPAARLGALDRFRLRIARAIVGGGDLVLVEDPTRLPTPGEHREALDLLPVLASHGTCAILATADPDAAALATRAILLANGRVSADLVPPEAGALAELLGTGAEDPATLLGPIPSALPASPARPAFPAPIDEGGAASEPAFPAPIDEGGAASEKEGPAPAEPVEADSGPEDAPPVEGGAEGAPPRRSPIFRPLTTPTPAQQARESTIPNAGARPAAAPTLPDSLADAEPEPTMAAEAPFEPAAPLPQPLNGGGLPEGTAVAASPSATPGAPLPVGDDDEDPITRAIRVLGREDADSRRARPSAAGARIAALPDVGPAPLAPTPEQAAVIDRARKILEELPGPVVPEE